MNNAKINKKINIIYYSGHCEIVGGDAKYIMDLVNEINRASFRVTLYTDKNEVFRKRANQWLSDDINVNYIDTKPRLFHVSKIDVVLTNLSKNKHVRSILENSIFGFKIKRLIKRILIAVCCERLRADISNINLFLRLFRKKNKAEIFHYNNGGYPGKRAGLIAIIIASRLGLKTVMTVQNYPLPRKNINIVENIIDRVVGKYCNIIIPVANKVGDALEFNRGFPKEKIRTIYHGLQSHRKYSPNEKQILKYNLGILENDFVMIISANLGEDRKGHSFLFESLVSVKKKNDKFKLLVVGDGVLRAPLEKMVHRIGLSNNILFLGHREDIAILNSISDLAINPSVIYEGIPYTIREAMLEGKPVITTSAGGNEEAVFHNVNGLIVKQEDSVDLYEAIMRLLSNEQLRADMGKRGLEIFNEKFVLSDKIGEHENLYREILRD